MYIQEFTAQLKTMPQVSAHASSQNTTTIHTPTTEREKRLLLHKVTEVPNRRGTDKNGVRYLLTEEKKKQKTDCIIYTSRCVISKETDGPDADDPNDPSRSTAYATSSFTTCLYRLRYVGNLDMLLTIPTILRAEQQHHHQKKERQQTDMSNETL